jgi:hypothetical protein
MILSTNANLWAIAGTVYALAGASLLCNSLFLTPAPDGSGASGDAFTRRRLYEQWLDARVGAALVVIGFFLQATGSLGSGTLKVPAAFVLLGLALGAVYYALMKGLLIENLLEAAEPQRSDRPLAIVHRSEVAEVAPAAPIAPPSQQEVAEVPAAQSAV